VGEIPVFGRKWDQLHGRPYLDGIEYTIIRNVCAEGNYEGYCNPEVDKLIDRQSAEANQEKRRELVWQIERKLVEDGARPIIFYPRAATCSYPYVKGLTIMVNSIYNGWRFEDVWLDK
jgi:peptide/nickel transport system substrate-binding protein